MRISDWSSDVCSSDLLASNEYWRAAQTHIPSPIRVISIDFREEGPNGLRFNSFAAKRARGMMARYMCEHHLSEPESLNSFDSDGYVHDQDGPEGTIWCFVRRLPEFSHERPCGRG